MAKKVLYKVAFHGGFNNIWSSLMTIPEVNCYICDPDHASSRAFLSTMPEVYELTIPDTIPCHSLVPCWRCMN